MELLHHALHLLLQRGPCYGRSQHPSPRCFGEDGRPIACALFLNRPSHLLLISTVHPGRVLNRSARPRRPSSGNPTVGPTVHILVRRCADAWNPVEFPESCGKFAHILVDGESSRLQSPPSIRSPWRNRAARARALSLQWDRPGHSQTGESDEAYHKIWLDRPSLTRVLPNSHSPDVSIAWPTAWEQMAIATASSSQIDAMGSVVWQGRLTRTRMLCWAHCSEFAHRRNRNPIHHMLLGEFNGWKLWF